MNPPSKQSFACIDFLPAMTREYAVIGVNRLCQSVSLNRPVQAAPH